MKTVGNPTGRYIINWQNKHFAATVCEMHIGRGLSYGETSAITSKPEEHICEIITQIMTFRPADSNTKTITGTFTLKHFRK